MKNLSRQSKKQLKATPGHDTIKVFVYGTLKVGGHFAAEFNSVRLDSKPGTIQGTLYSITDGFFPGVKLEGKGEVHGELHTYEKAEAVLARLDQIEGEGYLYDRTAVEVRLDDGEVEEAITYIYKHSTENDEIIENGVFEI